ncbi:MAG: type I-E CRISPR-associated protein Cas7/Cse4/CasC [Anaerolineae bacterium]|nr:type I-E CRISPR-associated protein Cas7/Cse4/CasC [Anaerolineae bacterium]
MFIELHIIQNFAPSNLNRDDTGNPKDCEFGGVRRARVSSQSFKRAIRLAPVFAQTTRVDVAIRSRWVMRALRKTLVAAPYSKPDEEIKNVLEYFIPAYFSKLDKKQDTSGNTRTAVLLYLGPDELQTITTALVENWDALLMQDGKMLSALTRDLIKQQQGVTGAPDIALFGRMLAEKPVLNMEAACQVAHAISTHRVTMEMDFFTAVDDLLKPTEEDDESGAGMMGFTGFDSPCFYRYIRLDWEQLVNNLKVGAEATAEEILLARRTVEAFLRAVVEAVPTGKQNTFAAHNPPSFMLAAVRKGSFAWSLANAFEKPVYPRGNSGLIVPSVEKLDTYWGQLVKIYGISSLEKVAALPLDPGLTLDALNGARVVDLESWIGAVLEALPVKEA